MELYLKLEPNNFKSIKRIIKFLSLETALDWGYLSANMAGNPEDKSFIKFLFKYDSYINFDELSSNTKINWTIYFIETYSHRLNLSALSENIAIPFTKELITKYKNEWKWEAEGIFSHKYAWHELGGLSYNPRFPIDKTLISLVADKIDFRALGMNPSLIVFDPKSIYDEDWPCELDVLKKNITVIMEFWDKWSFKGSTWVDNNIVASGTKKDSIYDNKNIDWKFINIIRPYYKTFLENWEHPKPNMYDDNDLPF